MSQGIQHYLDRSLAVVKEFGLSLMEREEANGLVRILEEVRDVDESKVMAVAQTVKYIHSFNEMMRENIAEADIGQAYLKISEAFDSIIEDGNKMVGYISDGKIDLGERLKLLWMNAARGSIHDRFEGIREDYLDVQERTGKQVVDEEKILNAYQDYGIAVQKATSLAYEVMKSQEGRLGGAQETLRAAQKTLDESENQEDSVKVTLRTNRDLAQRELETERKKYQLLKDVAENLEIGYHASNAIMAKLKQTHEAKDAVYRRAVTFFRTNETVFTGLDALFTSQKGLDEITRAQNAMTQGANKGIEAIAGRSQELEKRAIEAAYGETISADSVKQLIDSVVDFQTSVIDLTNQYSQKATENARIIRETSEEGARKIAGIIANYEALPTA